MADTATTQIRRAFKRIAERLKAKITTDNLHEAADYVLRVIADEFERESLGKKDKP